jgi:hypothetical protein
MKLQEVFDQLSSGEFEQLSIGGAAAGVIDSSNYARLLGHINLGLTAIFKRFTLKEGRLVLAPQDNQTDYTISSAFAVNGRRTTEPVRYLLDSTADPFVDDILKIEKVLTDSGCVLGLNDHSDCFSCFTPTATSLRIPKILVDGTINLPPKLVTENLTLIYRANHPKIVMPVGYFDPNRVELQLPYTHLEPLLFFVAARVTTPRGLAQMEGQSANAYLTKYEHACAVLENQGYQVDQGAGNTRLCRNGWV